MLTIYYFSSQEKKLLSVEPGKLAETWNRVVSSSDGNIWVDFQDTTEQEFDILRNVFKFHPLSIEDCILPQERPKVDVFSDYLFIITHSIFYYKEKDPKEGMSNRELNIFLGKNFLVTLHNERVKAITVMQERLKTSSVMMGSGPDLLLHSIFNLLIENYFLTLDELEDHMDTLEDKIFLGKFDNALLNEIFIAKKNVLYLRKFLSPQRELMSQLMHRDLPFIHADTRIYFRDAANNLVRVHELIESYRDFLTSLMEAYLSLISNRLNDIMKTLTIIATLMMPLTLITSFYGMNLEIPEFKWGIFGYLFVLSIISLVTVSMVIYFRKKKFL